MSIRCGQGADDVDVDVVETGIGGRECALRGLDVSVYFAALTFQTCFSPCTNVAINSIPHKPIGDEFLCRPDPGMREIMQGMEDGLAERCRDVWAGKTSRHVAENCAVG